MLLGVVAVAGIVWLMLPSEEERILQQIENLAEAASIEAGESALIRAARGARLAGHFTERARVDLGRPFQVLEGRAALTALATALRVPPDGIAVAILDATVNFERRLMVATGSMTARAASQSIAGEELFGVRTFTLTLRHVDGEWLIDDMRAVDP